MSSIIIQKDKLTSHERNLLSEELHKFPHVGFISPEDWKKFSQKYELYIARENRQLVGVCMTVKLNHFIKIGPLIVLAKYQGKGFGWKLLSFIIKRNSKDNLYIGSSNSRVWKIAEGLDFKPCFGFWKLPLEIKFYLIGYFLERLSWNFITDALSKGYGKDSEYRYYFREATFSPANNLR